MRQINYGDINRVLLKMLKLYNDRDDEIYTYKLVNNEFVLYLTNKSTDLILNNLYGFLSYRSRKNIKRIIERYSSRMCFDQSQNISKNYFNQLQIWYRLTRKFLIIRDTVYVNLLEYENWKRYFHALDEDIFIINHIVNEKRLYAKDKFDFELAKNILYPLKTFITPYDPMLRQQLEAGMAVTHAHLSGCYPAPFYWVAVMNCRISEDDIRFVDNHAESTKYNTGGLPKTYLKLAKKIRLCFYQYLKNCKDGTVIKITCEQVYNELEQVLEHEQEVESVDKQIQENREEYIDYFHLLDLPEFSIHVTREDVNRSNHIISKSLYGERLLLFFVLYELNAKKCSSHMAQLFWFYIQVKNTFLSNVQQQEGIAGFDFFEHTLRQITWKESSQKNPFFTEIGEFLQESGSVIKLELMIAPQKSRDEYDKIINSIVYIKKEMDRGLSMQLKSRVNETKVGVIVHFIKNEGNYLDVRQNSNQDAYRMYHYSIRDEIKKYADELYKYKIFPNTSEKSSNIAIVAIDTANRELYCPPEVFGETYQMLFEQNFYIESSRKFKGKTYHVGEDFEHIMTGMRRIYEAIYYLNISAGDRLGHCIALGLDVERWAYSNGTVEINKIDWLDNSIFEWYILRLRGVKDFTRIGMLEHRIADLSFDIFGTPVSPQILINAWLKRGSIVHNEGECFDSEENIPVWIQLQGQVMKTCKRKGCHSVISSVESLENICNKYGVLYDKPILLPEDEADRVLMEYLYDKHTIDNFLELTSVDTITEIPYMIKVQELLIDIIKEKSIVIESNPTSNWLIAGLDSFSSVPCVQWLLMDRQIPFSINIDDPSVFGNTVENEYYLVFSAMLKGSEGLKGVERERALEWLNKVRITGIKSSFL